MTHWENAVEAGAKAGPSCTSCGAPPTTKRCPMCKGLAEDTIRAALPDLRQMLAEELRAEANDLRGDERYDWDQAYHFDRAADHLTRKEVME